MSGEDWLSDHVLGEETESDGAEARRRLDADPALRDRVARLAEVAGRLDGLSPAAWEIATDEPGAEQSAGKPAPRRAPSGRRLGRPALAAGLAVVALAIGIGVGALIWSGAGGGMASGGRTVALRPLPGTAPGAGGSARVTSAGQLVLHVRRLPAAGSGRYYEAWLMTDNEHLVSLASFQVRSSGSASVTVPLPAPAARYRYFDVSLQKASRGTAHSGDSVLRGPTG